MAKLMCSKCGGKVKKMGNGGVTPSKAIPRVSMGLNFGIPQQGTTNYSAATMRKGGAVRKMQDGGISGAELKRRGQVNKRLGMEAKLDGQVMKELGMAMKAAGKRKKAEGKAMKG
jgi:hypothetical protein